MKTGICANCEWLDGGNDYWLCFATKPEPVHTCPANECFVLKRGKPCYEPKKTKKK